MSASGSRSRSSDGSGRVRFHRRGADLCLTGALVGDFSRDDRVDEQLRRVAHQHRKDRQRVRLAKTELSAHFYSPIEVRQFLFANHQTILEIVKVDMVRL